MGLRTIAVWELLGGLLIVLAHIISAFQDARIRLGPLSVLSSLTIATLAVAAGLALWKRHPSGLSLSLAAQWLQVAWVSLPTLQFGSTLGPTLGLRITDATVTFNLGFYGRGGVAFLPPGTTLRFPTDITLNFLAFFAIAILIRERRVRRTVEAAA